MISHNSNPHHHTTQHPYHLAEATTRLLTRPNHAALLIRQWICTGCGTTHDRILPEECKNCGTTALEFEYVTPLVTPC